MLTSDLIKPMLRVHGSTLSVEMINEQSPVLQQTAQDLITLLHEHIGQRQETLEKALNAYEGERVDYVLIRGLAKVLTDAATFTPLPTPLPAPVLREKLFTYGPVFREPGMFRPRTRQETMEQVANELDLTAEYIDTVIFADRHAWYRLTDAGPSWTPAELLARYNLELARGVLYWASHTTIEASSNYKDLWKYMKLFKLMFWAEVKPEGGYRIDLDGPISPFVTATLRYGRSFGAFLPALMLCDQWRMIAHVHPPQAQGPVTYPT